ncbi:DUF6775 family putative metallopeptidase [Nitrosopumilus sp.]|uniref:DUF6775 family putative metallopeptidase n=1 Tax=Nitrosopumilus sp. TaxID=2024843 RepID=UPI0034A05A9B
MKISKIILYDEPAVPEIQIEKIKKFITDTFQIETELRGNFFASVENKVLEKIATVRVFDLKKQFKKHNPTQEECQIEKENRDMSGKDIMTLYDGFELQNIISESVSNIDDILHIVFTNKLTVTFDRDDFRYHARAIISSNPTIISTTGIIEAPAKARQYYLDLLTNFSEEKIGEIKEKYKGGFLEYHDSRLNEIVEGYILQAIMYYKTGEAFCEDKECRLFNAHWQKDLLYSQIESKKICDRHSEMIVKFRN